MLHVINPLKYQIDLAIIMSHPMIIAFMILAAVLISASIHDIRTREVPDIHWIMLCAAGIVTMMITLPGGHITVERMMICAGSVMIAADILHDREWPPHLDAFFYLALAVMFIMPLMTAADDPMVMYSMAISVCYILFLTLFFTGTIKGGADVKCLISMSLMFPVYPALLNFSMVATSPLVSAVISFPVAVLFHAAVLSLLLTIPMAVRNIIRGDTGSPRMFTGYRMSAEDAAGAHVWPIDAAPDSDGKVWVTPKIPFIVPITVAVFFVTFVGNVMFLV
jgi:preflagellin peptidase FlaK